MRKILFALLPFLLTTSVQANFIDVSLKLRIVNDGDRYSYFYRAVNDSLSTVPIERLILSRGCSSSDTDGVLFRPTHWNLGNYHIKRISVEEIPSFIDESQERIQEMLSARAAWTLGEFPLGLPALHPDLAVEAPPRNTINPAVISEEFGIRNSAHPPAILTFTAQGLVDRGPGPEDTGYVLGPRAPSDNPCNHLLQLIAESNQAADLGWIGPQNRIVSRDKNGPLKSIIAKLAAARAACMRGNTKAACNQLRALFRHVEAQRGKSLTDDGYNLLKYNVEYLREKMGCPKTSFVGRVQDPRGNPIRGAVVRLKSDDEENSSARTATSNSQGEFSFADVLSEEVTIVAEAFGFKTTAGGKELREGLNRTTIVMEPRSGRDEREEERSSLGSIKVHVRYKDRGVNAQGIDVTVTGPAGTITRKTGWGATSGEAVFESLQPGSYRVDAIGKSCEITIEIGERESVTIE